MLSEASNLFLSPEIGNSRPFQLWGESYDKSSLFLSWIRAYADGVRHYDQYRSVTALKATRHQLYQLFHSLPHTANEYFCPNPCLSDRRSECLIFQSWTGKRRLFASTKQHFETRSWHLKVIPALALMAPAWNLSYCVGILNCVCWKYFPSHVL